MLDYVNKCRCTLSLSWFPVSGAVLFPFAVLDGVKPFLLNLKLLEHTGKYGHAVRIHHIYMGESSKFPKP